MLEWHGSGMSVMEMSHRGKEFTSIHEAVLTDLLDVPASYRILFLQGGGIAEAVTVLMNLLGSRKRPPTSSRRARGRRNHSARQRSSVRCISPRPARRKTASRARRMAQLSADPAYVHLCTNETINSVETCEIPDLVVGGVPLVVNFSSRILSRPMDVAKYGVLFGYAQKNIGMAGVTVVIVREDLLDPALSICPFAFEWKVIVANNSLYNTRNTRRVHLCDLHRGPRVPVTEAAG